MQSCSKIPRYVDRAIALLPAFLSQPAADPAPVKQRRSLVLMYCLPVVLALAEGSNPSENTVPSQRSSSTTSSSRKGTAGEETPASSSSSAEGLGLLLHKAQIFWGGLTPPQQAYTAVVGILVLVAAPKVLTVLLLGVERLLIGALLAAEEVILQLLLKAGAVVSGSTSLQQQLWRTHPAHRIHVKVVPETAAEMSCSSAIVNPVFCRHK